MKRLILLLSFIFISGISLSQTHQISGTVKDAKFGEGLSFATVKVIDTAYGTVADAKGNFVLYLPNGDYKISFSNLGYFSVEKFITVNNENQMINIELERGGVYTEEIEFLAKTLLTT